MARSEGKAAGSNWQSKRQTKKRPQASSAKFKSRRRVFRYPEVRGKIIDFVEFSTDSDFHIVDIGFEDRTALQFIIDPAFIVQPGYSNWKTGNQRILRRWQKVLCS